MKRSTRITLVLGVLAAVAAVNIAVFFLIRSPSFKSWRASGLADDAIAALEEGDGERAFRRAEAAIQLAPANARALRAVALIHLAAESPGAVAAFQSLLATGEATFEDRLNAVRAALSAGHVPVAARVLAGLSAEEPTDLRYFLLQAEYALGVGDPLSALHWLDQAMLHHPDAGEIPLLRGRILLTAPDAERRGEGVELLARLAEGGGWSARDAARFLLATDLGDSDLRERLAEFLGAPDNARTEDLLLATAVGIQQHPERRGELLDALEARLLGRGNNVAARRDLAAWLTRHGEHARVDALLPTATALTREDWFLVWLDSQAARGNWEDIELVLSGRTVPLADAVAQLYLGRAAAEMGRPREADLAYQNAVTLAARDPVTLVYVAGYLGQVGQTGLQQQALQRLAANPALARFALQSQMTLAMRRGDTAEVLRVLEEKRRRWPQDQAVRSDLLYLSLLSGQRIAAGLAAALELLASQPQNVPLRITCALALLRNDQPAEALALFEKSDVELHHLLPGQRAVFAAVLQANGMDAAAREVAATIPAKALLPEEAGLLRERGL